MAKSETERSTESARTVQRKLSNNNRVRRGNNDTCKTAFPLQLQMLLWCCGCVGRRHTQGGGARTGYITWS
jgi:hypothetical protein